MKTVVRKFLRLTAYGLQLTAFLSLTSCAAPKAAKQVENGYLSVLEKWTREGKIYEDFETKLLIKSTFKSEEFRESYIDEYSKIYMLDGEKLRKLEKEEREAPKNYHEFFLSVHTPDIDWSDLEKKEPMWALYLINDMGEKVSPLEVKKVKKGPGVTRFYPYFGDWSVGYTVKFPINMLEGSPIIKPETRYFKFVMTGSPGRGELLWNVRP